MSIEEKIQALLKEANEQPTAAQASYPGATNPQDPAPYMGINFEELELDRPGVTGAEEMQQAQFPGQTGNVDPEPVPAEFMELDPFNPASDIVPNAEKESYPVGTGADDVQIQPEDANEYEENRFSADIKPANHPAPFVAESVISEAYQTYKPKKISAKSEGHIVVLDKTTASAVEKKLGLPKGALSVGAGKKYSETAVVKGADNKLHTVYANGDSVRIRSYGHKDADSTEALKKHLNESIEEAAQDANQDPQQDQDDVLQQAVAAVQSGNKIEDVAKATGLDIQTIKDAIDAAQPTASPSAPQTTAPVSESTVSSPAYFEDTTATATYNASGSVTDKNGIKHYKVHIDPSKPIAQHIIDQNQHIDDFAAHDIAKHLHKTDSDDIDNPMSYSGGKRTVVTDKRTNNVSESSFKSDVDSLLSEETLSEEFKTKAASLFEAAVVARVNNEAIRIQENFDSRLQSEIATLQEQYAQAVDTFTEQQASRLTNYINYLGEQWIKQNKLQVETGIRSEITEGFMKGLQQLFTEHYVSVPESKKDLVEDQQQKINQLEESIAQLSTKLESLTESNQVLKREAIIKQLSEGLSDIEVARMHSLCEGIEFESESLFESKVQLVKQNFFKQKPTQSPEQLLESNIQVAQPQEDQPKKQAIDPVIEAAAKALNRFKPLA